MQLFSLGTNRVDSLSHGGAALPPSDGVLPVGGRPGFLATASEMDTQMIRGRRTPGGFSLLASLPPSDGVLPVGGRPGFLATASEMDTQMIRGAENARKFQLALWLHVLI